MSRKECNQTQHMAKREVAKGKQQVYDELYERLETKEGEKDTYRVIKDRELMNEENERRRRVEEAEIVGHISKDEVR